MLYTTFYLGWTARVVGTIIGRLASVSHQWGAAFGAVTDKMNWLEIGRTVTNVHANNLWNDFATFFYEDVIADMEV